MYRFFWGSVYIHVHALVHSSDLEAFGEKILTRFYVFLDLVILVYINAISIDFYAIKSFICINLA